MDITQILTIGQFITSAVAEINRLSTLVNQALIDINSGTLTNQKVEDYYNSFKINNSRVQNIIDEKISKIENKV